MYECNYITRWLKTLPIDHFLYRVLLSGHNGFDTSVTLFYYAMHMPVIQKLHKVPIHQNYVIVGQYFHWRTLLIKNWLQLTNYTGSLVNLVVVILWTERDCNQWTSENVYCHSEWCPLWTCSSWFCSSVSWVCRIHPTAISCRGVRPHPPKSALDMILNHLIVRLKPGDLRNGEYLLTAIVPRFKVHTDLK